MKRLMWYVGCCMMPLYSASATYASPEIKSGNNTIATGNAASLGRLSSTDYPAPTTAPTIANNLLGQVPPPPPTPTDAPTTPAPAATPSDSETQEIQRQLDELKNAPQDNANTFQPKSSPAFSIFNPIGFGADKNLVFLSVSYQNRTRFGNVSDGEAGIGIGLGDAVNSVGAELSYSLNSFGSSGGFGSGAFNAKLHKRVGEDAAVAIGWNQFAKVQFDRGASDSG
ncbi:hypothetical protein [Chamaesiphon minutus]|uniref:Inverse autotransporter beta-domain domain-containing protein n=1 Tax=Chamaesiphon minutus (strain ATCC 27169 / PCC 6605) TaxID=1173020 RepID=K9UI70_CHAP6|nr:hypothetical protein [Chamaesiphon minutus]AFY94792.1 hypothetical protein Cha6605_3821 [Chamaesiphon minutus PCC 6605]